MPVAISPSLPVSPRAAGRAVGSGPTLVLNRGAHRTAAGRVLCLCWGASLEPAQSRRQPEEEEEEEGFPRAMGSSCSLAASWGDWVTPEEASLQPWLISKVGVKVGAVGLRSPPHTRLQQKGGSWQWPHGWHWPPRRFSLPLCQPGHPPPPAVAEPTRATQPVGQTGLSRGCHPIPIPVPQHRPGQRLRRRLGTAAVVCRAAAPRARLELHTQQNPNLPKNLNKLARRSGSRAGTQIPSSCLSHE